MRFKILLRSDKLPLIYRHIFMSMIKEALKQSNPDYKDKLYPDKNFEKTKVAKPFTFSIMMPPGRKLETGTIDINGKTITDKIFYYPEGSYLSFLLSSSDYEFVMNLYNGLIKMKRFEYSSDIKFEYLNSMLLNEKDITENEITFKTLSPILVENKNEKPVLPIQESLQNFNDELNIIQDKIFKDVRGFGLKSRLNLTPLNIRKQVVKHTLRGFREKTGRDYMTLTCFEGTFKLQGSPEDLHLLYQTGIGLRTGQGFGMVEVASE